MVVGRNGTGKSNLLEALTIIFRDLDLGQAPPFDFDIEYECRGSDIRIVARRDGSPRLRTTVDGRRVTQRVLRGENGPRYLPDFVFGYYSGPSNRLKAHFERHQDQFSRALRDGSSKPLRRLFYAQPMHSQFVLLAFFLDATQHEFLREYLRIESFESMLFVLQSPYWANRRQYRAEGDTRFWNARGAVAALLDELYKSALAPFRQEVEAVGEHGKRERREQLYLYFDDIQSISDLSASHYEGKAQELFKAFESILAADLLAELRVRVKAVGANGSLVFRELSEGEQQLLMVLGLLRFTREDESLFLLDEPDTHLNPAWSLRYAAMLEENSGSAGASSHLIMSTHDPLVIAGLLREQVILLDRDAATSLVTAAHPETDPRGMGVAGLLTSDVYALASDLDPETLLKVERRRYLATMPGKLQDKQQIELAQLTRELEELDFTFTVRDPLYAEFERASASIERTEQIVLDSGERKNRNAQARAILEKLNEMNADEGDAIH